MNIIDIGANLTHKSLRGDLDKTLTEASDAGVGHIIVTGTSVSSSLAAADLAQGRAGLSATAGIHPHDALSADQAALASIGALHQRPEVLAIGECGLDYNRNYSTPAEQRRCFEAQLQLAADSGLPLFLHERDAHQDFLAMLKDACGSANKPRLVVHCFTSTQAHAEAYLDLGAYIGITGWICDERRGADLQQAVGVIPLDRLLVETDAPFLLPRDLRPKPKTRRNEPRHLAHVLATLARLIEVTPSELAQKTRKNSVTLFGERCLQTLGS